MADPITTIAASDIVSTSRTTLNTNFNQRLWMDITTSADANYTVTSSTECLFISAVTTNRAVTLPAGTGGQRLIVFCFGTASGTYTVTITPDGSETIDGSASQVLNADTEFVEIMYDGTSNWLILAKNV